MGLGEPLQLAGGLGSGELRRRPAEVGEKRQSVTVRLAARAGEGTRDEEPAAQKEITPRFAGDERQGTRRG